MSPNHHHQHSSPRAFHPRVASPTHSRVASPKRSPPGQVAELVALEKQTRSLAGTFEDLNANFGKINQSMSGALSHPGGNPGANRECL